MLRKDGTGRISAMKSHWKTFAFLLAVLALVRLAVMATVPVFDTSESRYAALSANMAESGDFLVPRFSHKGVLQSFNGKPPLLFQAGGALCAVFGRHELAVRLPPFLAAAGLLALLFFAVRRLKDADAARTAVLFCATSVVFYVLSGFCMTDMPLTFCVGGALLLESVFIKSPSRWISRAVFALLGLGMLAKGPVALVLFGLPVLLDAWANRRLALLARHDWIGGPLVFLALAAPWYVLMERETPGFLRYFLVHENFLRFLVHDYGDQYGGGHETFRGMAALWAVVATLPWTPLLLLTSVRIRFRDGAPETLLAWGVAAIVGFWCLTSRVPLAYLLPIVPLFAARLSLAELPRGTARVVPAAAAVCFLALACMVAFLTFCTGKMSGWTFKALHAAEPDRGAAFMRKSPPYSAQFYFGPQLHLVPQPGDRIFVRGERRWEEAPHGRIRPNEHAAEQPDAGQ